MTGVQTGMVTDVKTYVRVHTFFARTHAHTDTRARSHTDTYKHTVTAETLHM